MLQCATERQKDRQADKQTERRIAIKGYLVNIPSPLPLHLTLIYMGYFWLVMHGGGGADSTYHL
jgi:hypothetical protein